MAGDEVAAREQLQRAQAWAQENRGKLQLDALAQRAEFQTNQAGVIFYTSGRLEVTDLECELQGVLLPVGK